MITVIIEYANHCDIVNVPAGKYAQLAYGLNKLDCRYWIHYRELAGYLSIRGN